MIKDERPPRRRGRPTIKDVAARAGVSYSTVSRALSGGYCAPETLKRIQEAVAELGYQPDAVARSLIRGSTQQIGLIIPDITNPFFPQLARGVEDRARQHGYTVMLANTDGDPEQERAVLASFRSLRVAGLIIQSFRPFAGRARELARELPVVVMEQPAARGVTDWVGCDAALCVDRAMEHLLALGHRRIGFLSGPRSSAVARQRESTFRQWVRRHQLPVREDWVKNGRFRFEDGYAAAREILGQPDRPTAILAANDLMAVGALVAANHLGLRVPADLSVVGVDDIPMARMTVPPLTTVRQPTYQMGAAAADLLLERIRTPELPLQERWFLPELVVRESTGPAPADP